MRWLGSPKPLGQLGQKTRTRRRHPRFEGELHHRLVYRLEDDV